MTRCHSYSRGVLNYVDLLLRVYPQCLYSLLKFFIHHRPTVVKPVIYWHQTTKLGRNEG